MTPNESVPPHMNPSVRRHKVMTFCAVAIACVAAVVMLVFHYRFHLWWIYTCHRLELDKNTAFQSRPMPYVPVPPTWVTHRLGEIEFALPPEFHADDDETISGKIYRHGTKCVFITSPTNYDDLVEYAYATFNMQPQFPISTLPMFRNECYQTASSKFSWSMSPSDARRYLLCALFAKMFRVSIQGENAELLGDGDIDGMAMFAQNRITVDWQCKKTVLGGYIHFFNGDDPSASDVDYDWVRAVCQSLKTLTPKASEER